MEVYFLKKPWHSKALSQKEPINYTNHLFLLGLRVWQGFSSLWSPKLLYYQNILITKIPYYKTFCRPAIAKPFTYDSFKAFPLK